MIQLTMSDNEERLMKVFECTRPLKFWDTPSIYLLNTNYNYTKNAILGAGWNQLTAVKDALFNLKRGVSYPEYRARRIWLLEMLEAGELYFEQQEVA